MKSVNQSSSTATADFSGNVLAIIYLLNKSVIIKTYLLPFNVSVNGPIRSTPKTVHLSET